MTPDPARSKHGRLPLDLAHPGGEPVRRALRVPVVVSKRIELAAYLNGGREIGPAQPDPDMHEVGIGLPTLPHPVEALDDPEQALGVRVQDRGDLSLRRGDFARSHPRVGQVCPISQALAAARPAGGLPGSHMRGHHDADGGHGKQDSEDDQKRLAERDHVAGHTDAAQQGEDHRDHRACGGGVGRLRRRWEG